jgi:hypothetical protein
VWKGTKTNHKNTTTATTLDRATTQHTLRVVASCGLHKIVDDTPLPNRNHAHSDVPCTSHSLLRTELVFTAGRQVAINRVLEKRKTKTFRRSVLKLKA